MPSLPRWWNGGNRGDSPGLGLASGGRPGGRTSCRLGVGGGRMRGVPEGPRPLARAAGNPQAGLAALGHGGLRCPSADAEWVFGKQGLGLSREVLAADVHSGASGVHGRVRDEITKSKPRRWSPNLLGAQLQPLRATPFLGPSLGRRQGLSRAPPRPRSGWCDERLTRETRASGNDRVHAGSRAARQTPARCPPPHPLHRTPTAGVTFPGTEEGTV